MSKCPKCEAELREGLSFCPKCGEIIGYVKINKPSVNSKSVKVNSSQKKNTVLKVCLWFLLLPIMLTIAIIKNKKLNKNIKIIFIAVLWFCVIIIGVTNQNSNEKNTGNDTTTETQKEAIEEEKQNIVTEDTKSKKETDENEVKYHGNKTINKLITEYNSLAEVVITPDMVSNGAYSSNAKVSCNGVSLLIYKSDAGIFIDYSQETKDDSHIYTLFRDFAKTLKPDITDDEIQTGFDELRTGDWKNYTKYDMNGIECTYFAEKLTDGQIRYSIKTGYIGKLIFNQHEEDKILNSDNTSVSSSTVYSEMQLLNLPQHPVMFDGMKNIKEYYENIDDSRIAIVSIQEHYQLQRDLKNIFDDPIVVYFIQHSTNEKFIGTVQINIFQDELCKNMDIDKAVGIITSYLPKDFLKYYKLDSAYSYEIDDMKVYTYACRLNDVGIEFQNNHGVQYSNYYNFKIFHYQNTNKWKLETDYAAYGDKDVGWIEKYADNWDVDLNDYFQ